MTRRAKISDRTKLAATLCALFDIPWEHQCAMHEDQVLSLVHFDHHPRRKVDGGSDLFSNLRPLLIAGHREKTAEIDQPEIAKGKRLRESERQHQERRAGRAVEPRRKRTIPSRPFPDVHRPLRSRSSFQERSR